MTMNEDASFYNQTFFEQIRDGSFRSAENVIPIVLEFTGKIESVLDVGCGVGTWLAAFAKAGVETLTGLDGSYVNRDMLYIPKSCFVPTDLQEPFDLGRKYDLVVSLEVGEHLPAECARQYVSSMCAHGDLILFSAAIPGQGGMNHINEAYPSYWAALFAECECYPIDRIRRRIWNNSEIEIFYRQNILLFARKGSPVYQQYYEPDNEMLNVIHP
jgi:2-polyprenyl-3-methyl-5-hydroxy-6-metoxy-1,4-benzoquinol methylase